MPRYRMTGLGRRPRALFLPAGLHSGSVHQRGFVLLKLKPNAHSNFASLSQVQIRKMIPSLKLIASYIFQHLRHPFLLLFGIRSSRFQNVATESQKRVLAKEHSFFDKIPSGSWDSHMHILDPHTYPLAGDARYTPKTHSLADANAFERSVGITNIVLVQPSIYGFDNSCMLDALRQLGPQRARAVVSFDPEITPQSTLQEWNKIGVRGVRVNLQSVGKSVDAIELKEMLQQYADVIRPFGWVLQMYVPLDTATALETIIPRLGVKVCLDHFGCPTLDRNSAYSSRDPYLIPGFKSLVKLLQQGSTYVKMSAPYRLTDDKSQQDLEPLARELLRVAGNNRVVFATDWPHTRFEGLNIKPFIETVMAWCQWDDFLIERLFRSNARDLWGVDC